MDTEFVRVSHFFPLHQKLFLILPRHSISGAFCWCLPDPVRFPAAFLSSCSSSWGSSSSGGWKRSWTSFRTWSFQDRRPSLSCLSRFLRLRCCRRRRRSSRCCWRCPRWRRGPPQWGQSPRRKTWRRQSPSSQPQEHRNNTEKRLIGTHGTAVLGVEHEEGNNTTRGKKAGRGKRGKTNTHSHENWIKKLVAEFGGIKSQGRGEKLRKGGNWEGERLDKALLFTSHFVRTSTRAGNHLS